MAFGRLKVYHKELVAKAATFEATLYKHCSKKVLVLFCIVLQTAYWFKVADNDLFARVAVGRLVTFYNWVPLSDPFAYTPTKNIWIDHEWLSGLIFYLISQNGGDIALFALDLVTALFTLYFLVAAQHSHIGHSRIGFVLLFFAIFPCSFIWNSVIRAQVFTFFFFTFLLFCLTRLRFDNSLKFAGFLPIIFVLWANLHGGFVVGLGILVLACLAALVQKKPNVRVLLLTTVLSAIAVLLNPYGLKYVEFILAAALKPRPQITEWALTTLSVKNLVFYFICGLALGCMLLPKTKSRIPLEGLFFIIVTMVFAIKHQRHVPFFLFCVCVYLAPALEEASSLISNWAKERARSVYTAVVFLSLFSVITGAGTACYALSSYPSFSLDYSQYPVQAMSWLRMHVRSGNLLIHFNHGSYALLTGYPNFKVSIDGRYEEIYPESTFTKALSALNPNDPEFKQSFLSIRPDIVILCRDLIPHETANFFPGAWQKVFVDDSNNCAVFTDKPVLIKNNVAQPHLNQSVWELRF